MPIRRIVMVRRKPGLTPEQFREGYENGHARLAVRLFGHLWLSYRRNYLTTGHNFAAGSETAVADDTGFDAISEYVLRDEAALAEMGRIGAENMASIKEDEAKWFDQARCWNMSCESVEEEGLGQR
jgi:EthD domain